MSKQEIERLTSQLLEQELPTPEEGDWGPGHDFPGNVFVVIRVQDAGIVRVYSTLAKAKEFIRVEYPGSAWESPLVITVSKQAWMTWVADTRANRVLRDEGEVYDLIGYDGHGTYDDLIVFNPEREA